MAKSRGVRGAAGACAAASLVYLLGRSLLALLVSALMGLAHPGASLAKPLGFSDVSAALFQLLVGIGAIALTLEPCPMCSGAIINSRLKRVVYGARDPKAGCCGSLTDLFALPFNHHPVMESGLLEEEAQALLQDFFAMLREKRKKK